MTVRDKEVGASGTQQRDLILRIINNYTFYEISPIILTLRKTSFEGHVCLFAGENTNFVTLTFLRLLGVEVIRYKENFPFVSDPHLSNFKSLPDPIYIYNYRHYLYLDYLLKSGSKFRNVLITDIRDVVFQSSPFDFNVQKRVHVAMENVDVPIGACPWNSRWIVSGFGDGALDAVRDAEVSCAGTTIAPLREMERYLTTMLAKIQQMADAYECADQAAHNLLLHEGRLGSVIQLYNFKGPVLTVGTETSHRQNERCSLLNEDGTIINLIHQYDRHPELVRHFEIEAWPSSFLRFWAKAFDWFERRSIWLIRRRSRLRCGS